MTNKNIRFRPWGSGCSASLLWLCLVKTKSTFEINDLKKRDVTMLHAIWLGEITIRHGQERTFFLSVDRASNCKICRVLRSMVWS
jgi:hypothetical protein